MLSCTHQGHEDHEPGQLHSSAIHSFAGQDGEADAVPTQEEEPSVVLHQPLLGNHFGMMEREGERGFQSPLSKKKSSETAQIIPASNNQSSPHQLCGTTSAKTLSVAVKTIQENFA